MSITTGALAMRQHTFTDSTWAAALDELEPLDKDGAYEGVQLESVYIIHAPDHKLIKIGYSTDVHRRLIDLRYETKADLQLIGTLKGGRHLEYTLHRNYQHWHVDGEWFNERALPEIEQLLKAA